MRICNIPRRESYLVLEPSQHGPHGGNFGVSYQRLTKKIRLYDPRFKTLDKAGFVQSKSHKRYWIDRSRKGKIFRVDIAFRIARDRILGKEKAEIK